MAENSLFDTKSVLGQYVNNLSSKNRRENLYPSNTENTTSEYDNNNTNGTFDFESMISGDNKSVLDNTIANEETFEDNEENSESVTEKLTNMAKEDSSYLKYPLATWLKNKALKYGPKKLATKAGMRFVPGLGWIMAGLDALDYGTGIYDYVPGGEHLTWRDDYENKFPGFKNADPNKKIVPAQMHDPKYDNLDSEETNQKIIPAGMYDKRWDKYRK
tara:strand:- start:115 stop:765 length:651 start_codon:yes stop_codon:yes gene_type:complete